MVNREAVVWAYRLILGREPESEATIEAQTQLDDVETLRISLLNSYEFGNKHTALLSRLPCILNFREEWGALTREYYQAIDNSGISLDQVREMYAAAGLSQNQYTLAHLRRFHELFAYLAPRVDQSRGAVKFLEIGTSAHTTPFYRQFLACDYDTICRPAELGGPDQQWAAAAGSRNHYEIDLDYPERYVAIDNDIKKSSYDIVICCEVIEHLRRAPRDLINFALSKLKPNGFLYMTTPNFLTPNKIHKLYAAINPNVGFTEYNNNYHAHHHFREYTGPEIVDEIAQAGGDTKGVIFSNCWDHPEFMDDYEIAFRSNLVAIVSPGAATPSTTAAQ